MQSTGYMHKYSPKNAKVWKELHVQEKDKIVVNVEFDVLWIFISNSNQKLLFFLNNYLLIRRLYYHYDILYQLIMNILYIEAELIHLEYQDRGSFIFLSLARFWSNRPRVTFSLYVQKIDVSQFKRTIFQEFQGFLFPKNSVK